MTLKGTFEKDLLLPGSSWELSVDINCFKSSISDELVTQASKGRKFKVLQASHNEYKSTGEKRLFVILLEDGYICWINELEIKGNIKEISYWEAHFLDYSQIHSRIFDVLSFIEKAYKTPNKYLWGGTIGPDFDCSGLIQRAFAENNIWIPRDAYQQERFCKEIKISLSNYQSLIPGDLIFFGTTLICNHVGIYRGDGLFWHSSGKDYGRNGIGLDDLDCSNKHPVSCHYRNELRGAGRVMNCHDGQSFN
tara:strand:+ start:187 stop:936 length:750 start_codon:yes stop_codon:yes gene_type:complete